MAALHNAELVVVLSMIILLAGWPFSTITHLTTARIPCDSLHNFQLFFFSSLFFLLHFTTFFLLSFSIIDEGKFRFSSLWSFRRFFHYAHPLHG